MIPTLAQVNQERARRHHLDFMRLTWQRPIEPFLVGIHTRAICQRIDLALEDFRQRRSSFIVVQVPFRHGKSDLVSRYLPSRFLAEFPDGEVLLCTYGGELAAELSRFARRLLDSPEYKALFPDIAVSRESSAAERWSVAGHSGGMAAVGFGGPMTGRGFALGIVDDFLKSREEAESHTVEDSRWNSFTNDFLTRRAPVSITLVVTTRWTTFDPIARLEKAMADDDRFPRFEFLRFPALSDKYPTGTLFPERFPAEWYETQRATLGSYAFAGLMQQEPVQRGGNMFKVDNIDRVEMEAIPKGLRWVRSWDLASTEKQVAKRDPDYSVGTLLAVEYRAREKLKPVMHVWIAHVIRGQWQAPQRDAIAEQVAQEDGPTVRLVVEAVAGYRDTLANWRDRFLSRREVMEYKPTSDKVSRAEQLLAVCEAGCLHLLKGPWNTPLVEELAVWPFGGHDDQVDSIVAGMATGGQETEILGIREYFRRHNLPFERGRR